MDKLIWTSKDMNAIANKLRKRGNFVCQKRPLNLSQNSQIVNCIFLCLTLKKSNAKQKSWSWIASASRPKSVISSSGSLKIRPKSSKPSKTRSKLVVLQKQQFKKDLKSSWQMAKGWRLSRKRENSKWRNWGRVLHNFKRFRLRFSKILVLTNSTTWFCQTKSSHWQEKSMTAF